MTGRHSPTRFVNDARLETRTTSADNPVSQEVRFLGPRELGVEVEFDRCHIRPPQGWPRWREEQLRPENSQFVLAICTETYCRRIEGGTAADEGRAFQRREKRSSLWRQMPSIVARAIRLVEESFNHRLSLEL